MVDGVDIAARLSMQAGNPPAKVISPGLPGLLGTKVAMPKMLESNAVLTGQICGPFAPKGKQTAMMAQFEYERQVMSRMNNENHATLAQACAAAAPIQGMLQGTGNIFEGNGLGGMGLGGGSKFIE